MSLLQSVVEELDRELTRLHALRSLVADLSRTPKAVARLISQPVTASKPLQLTTPAPPNIEHAKPARKVRADAGKPRERRAVKSRASSEPRAFTAVVPNGPVVVNPARLAEEKAKREQSREAVAPAEPVPSAEDLDALSRNLAARWSTGLIQ